MKRTQRILVSVLACAAFSTSMVLAQNSGRRHGEGQRPPKPLIDTALDTDGDEIMSADELANAGVALATLDNDGDGTLSANECLPQRPRDPRHQPSTETDGSDMTGKDSAPPAPRKRGGGGPKPPIFTALDADDDGTISADELANAATVLRALDSDGDGTLGPDEYRPPRREGRQSEDSRTHRNRQGGSAE